MEFLKQSIASHDRQIGELTDRLAEVSEHLDNLTIKVDTLTTHVDTLTLNMHKLVEVSNQDAIAISKLAAIAERHQQRLDNLEGGR